MVLSQCWKTVGTVYVHWPYCTQLCTYCNFNKYVRHNVDHGKMMTCLVNELTSLIKLSGIQIVTSVYFGGGTPSLAEPGTVEAILTTVRDHSELKSGAEVTLEANPTSSQTDKLRAFKMAGVTRLSVGVQSFVDTDLKLMNRDHSVAESERCLSEAHQLFPGQVNIDVIFGRPHQTLTRWTNEFRKLQAVSSNHVSLYQLTIERGTALARAVNRNEMSLPPSDAVAEMYETAIELLDQVGLKRYEISNFSAQGYESQHNLSYWRGSNYLGIGPGAHSRFHRPSQSSHFTHTVNTPEPNAWMNKVSAKGHGMQKVRPISHHERLEEVMATSMRMTEGLTTEVWERFNPHIQLQEIFCNHPLIATGHLVVDDLGMRATDRGLSVLDSVLPELIACLE